MGVSSYINALNSGNISKIKKGRSFAKGGIQGAGELAGEDYSKRDLQKSFKSGKLDSNKTDQQIEEMIKLLEKIASEDKNENSDDLKSLSSYLKSLNKKDRQNAVGYIEHTLSAKGKSLELNELEGLSK
jgi:hypothetical protein